MKKLIIPIVFILSLISSPAKANSCNLPFLEEGVKKTGTINVQVLFVKYPDSPKTSKGYLKELLSTLDLKEVQNYFKQASYGKAKIKFTIHNKWVTLPANSYDYEIYEQRSDNWLETETNFFKSVLASADPVVDFSKVDSVYVIPDPRVFQVFQAFRDPQIVDGKLVKGMMYNDTSPYGITHELLHTLGLRDLYGNIGAFGPGGGMEHYSIMSQYYGGTSITGFEKNSLGWMNPNDVLCHTGGSINVKLNSLDSKGLKLVMVPLNGQELLAIEYRKSEKVDKYLGSTGVLVYYVNPSIRGTGPNDLPSPLSPLFFGKKGSVNFGGVQIDINKTNVTVMR